MADDTDVAADRVREDHALHWLALLAVAGYALYLHGVLIGLAVLVGLLIVISVANMILLTTTGSLRAVRFNRWGWIMLAAAALAVWGAEISTVS